ncbi:MAG: AAA family ATPase [Gammaproteobacteria bacterium]|nr:AAA family ATPase [Gammaproteobacteria bacterium]
MYLKHFSLQELPFSITPDTSFLFKDNNHQEALNTILIALAHGDGFIKITGEVGTGKTMLCRTLLKNMADNFITAYIPNPFLPPLELYIALADELSIEHQENIGLHKLVKLITEKLIALIKQDKKVVLLIDEAQALPDDSLEALRLITNIETEKFKLIQIVLFGQPELNERLNLKKFRQLKQRITFSYTLQPLDYETATGYISHRLTHAGWNGPSCFKKDALKYLFNASRGIPRLLNILCHKSLMAAYGKGDINITRKHAKLAVDDTEDASLPASRIILGLKLILLIAAGAIFAYLSYSLVNSS